MTPPLLLTERILVRLGRPRLFRVALWSLVPSATLSIGYLAARGLVGPELAWEQLVWSRYGLIVSWTYVVLGVLLLTPFWLGLLAQAQALVDRFADLPEGPRAQPFRGVASTYVPLLLAVGVALVYLLPDYEQYGLRFMLAMLPLSALGNIPPMAGLWLAIVIFLGLHRLGRLPLKLESFITDRSLGLRPFGRLALWAFVPFATFIVPFTFVGRRMSDIILNFGMLLIGTALFLSVSCRPARPVAAGQSAPPGLGAGPDCACPVPSAQ